MERWMPFHVLQAYADSMLNAQAKPFSHPSEKTGLFHGKLIGAQKSKNSLASYHTPDPDLRHEAGSAALQSRSQENDPRLQYGCFYKLGGPLLSALRTRALLFGAYRESRPVPRAELRLQLHDAEGSGRLWGSFSL